MCPIACRCFFNWVLVLKASPQSSQICVRSLWVWRWLLKLPMVLKVLLHSLPLTISVHLHGLPELDGGSCSERTNYQSKHFTQNYVYTWCWMWRLPYMSRKVNNQISKSALVLTHPGGGNLIATCCLLFWLWIFWLSCMVPCMSSKVNNYICSCTHLYWNGMTLMSPDLDMSIVGLWHLEPEVLRVGSLEIFVSFKFCSSMYTNLAVATSALQCQDLIFDKNEQTDF